MSSECTQKGETGLGRVNYNVRRLSLLRNDGSIYMDIDLYLKTRFIGGFSSRRGHCPSYSINQLLIECVRPLNFIFRV